MERTIEAENARHVRLASQEQFATMRFRIAAETEHPLPQGLEGRGIVICAGGERYLPSAWVGVNQLRRLGCQLPIEIWHFAGEISDRWRRVLSPLEVAFVNATDRLGQQPMPPSHGWQLKSFAIVFSRFREVLLLDADNLAVEDPTHLFYEPDYQHHGSIFWKDTHGVTMNDRIWNICAVERSGEPEFESGQILVDKLRCWQELLLALYMNERADFFYRYLYGDKDTFRFAWHRLGRKYATPAVPPRRNFGRSIFQPGLHGRRLFQHRTAFKWTLDENRRERDFWFEKECFEMIEELRETLGNVPARQRRFRVGGLRTRR